jgi:wyosine [tRNA(Phe)-imidazoG37] synthetase (radical SAM superfamily)
MEKCSQIFGPVPSRRLGYSLGVDVIPFKVCTLSCVYCELGRTTNLTLKRRPYVSVEKVLRELEVTLKAGQHIDYITFSGSGEPTLNSRLGHMIRDVRKMTSIPVAVLTNGTTLYVERVREDLMSADVVLPSLDAVSADIFRKINRPHGALNIDKIFEGLVQFRHEYSGKIWLEIMVVKGLNDTPAEIQHLKWSISRIRPDKVQLNTVVRPPAESDARPVSLGTLESMRATLSRNCEIIADFQATEQKAYRGDVNQAIQALTARRPVTVEDIAEALGLHRNEILKYIGFMTTEGEIRSWHHQGQIFYLNSTVKAANTV